MSETLLGVLGILIALFIIGYAIVDEFITRRRGKTNNISPKNIYYGKLESSDSSIENANNYLELTNSMYLKNNGGEMIKHE